MTSSVRRTARTTRLLPSALLALAVLGAGAMTAPSAVADSGTAPTRTAQRGTNVVARVDVDGDGAEDVVRLKRINRHKCQVKVHTAEGVVARNRIRRDTNLCRWHGAAALDTEDGNELSVVTQVGAHTTWTTILTWREDKLIVDGTPDDPSGAGDWMIDGAVNFLAGYQVRKPGKIVHTVLSATDGKHFHGKRRVMKYDVVNGWEVVKTRKVHVKRKRAVKLAGWSGSDLPRWPLAG